MVGGDVSTGGPVGSGSAFVVVPGVSFFALRCRSMNHWSPNETTAASATSPSTTSRILSVRLLLSATVTARIERGPAELTGAGSTLRSTLRSLAGASAGFALSRALPAPAFGRSGLGFGAVATTAPSPSSAARAGFA